MKYVAVLTTSRSTSVAITALALTGAMSCAAAAPQRPKQDAAASRAELVRFVGRVERDAAGHARYAWSGAGLTACFRGTGAVVLLRDDKNEHQVVLDGRPVSTLPSRQGQERYVLVEGLPLAEHRVELYRRTEALFGVTQFLGFEVLGGELLADTFQPRRRMELVGDSISCGYGNEGTSTDCPFSASTENHYLAYGSVLARKLEAELSTVAWSGRGVVKNYDGGPGAVLGDLYDRVLPESTSSRWQPEQSKDIVVVNVGTNDYSTEPDPAEQVFVEGYLALLGKLRHNNPTAFILCTVGPMLGGQDLERAEASIQRAVEQRKSNGDRRIGMHRMRTPNENPGCDWHPNLATHQRMADELEGVLRTTLGW